MNAPSTQSTPPLAQPVPYPVSQPLPVAPLARSGLRTASVPKILLGLGATCLLVAAVIFLAVAWSWLGIGGRTAVLVGLTGATGAGAAWLGRRGLPVAAEALTTVSLGLLVLDVLGANDAGWLGTLGTSGLACVVGGVLAAASLALLMAPDRLVVPQLAAPFGLTVLVAGVSGQTDHYQALAAAAVLTFAALAALGRARLASVLLWTAALAAAFAWATLGLLALDDAVGHPTVREIWLERHGWGLVAAAALSLLPLLARQSDMVQRVGAAFVLSTLSFVVALPGLDEGIAHATVVALVATIGWALVAAVVPPRWSTVPLVPLLGSALLPVITASALFLRGAGNLLTAGEPFSATYDVRLDPGPALTTPALLPVSVLALIVAAGIALPRSRSVHRWAAVLVVATGLGTLALYPVPLWSVLLPLVVAATALVADGLRRDDELGAGEVASAGVVLVATAVLAVPSADLATAVLAVLVLWSVAVLLRGRFAGAEEIAGGVLPVAVASLLWTAQEVWGTDHALRAGPILLLLGVIAIARPRREVELSAGVGVLVAAVAAIPVAEDVSVSLAVHLTAAGALVTASALVNPGRRGLGWLGGALLAAATWVRLYDVGVVAPEAYTLPSAVVLVLVGLRRLHTASTAPSMGALAPGLVLGTVPSLVWALADPVTLRAGLLGAGCLVLVLGGVQLRWNAPVVVGAVVGGLLVLRELAPYAAQTPQWVVIGLAGAVLITAGVTWESRMRDLQGAAAYLGRLR